MSKRLPIVSGKDVVRALSKIAGRRKAGRLPGGEKLLEEKIREDRDLK